MEKQTIEKIHEFIQNHLKDEFTLDELAEYAGYSSYHLARQYKNETGKSVMEYTRELRIYAAAKDIAAGREVLDTALDYCFDTHSGFTRAFSEIFGCTPKQYAEYSANKKINNGEREIKIMNDSKIVIRHICKDDVQSLWENVYSAMTPRQITEEKIIPMIEAYKKSEGLELVAEVDGKVVMSLPMTKVTWLPIGIVWDNNFTLSGGDGDIIMGKLVDEMKHQAKRMSITTLLSPQGKDSEPSKSMQSFGFNKVFESGGWEYLMMEI